MKCQQCDRTATFHITELTGGKPTELHLCEEHAREYLTHGPDDQPSSGGSMAKQLDVPGTAEELAELDQQSCPICGINFHEFRNKGRLGCPHDYVCFAKLLEPLLLNIHGAAEHVGKKPRIGPSESARQTELIRLRREMTEAVKLEDYERASQLRDEIRDREAAARHDKE
jgi:protein arginine kinase activator